MNAQGRLAELNGLLENAYQYYQQALMLLPDDPETLNNLGLLCVKQDKLDEALSYFTAMAHLNPNSESWYNVACLYEKQHKFHEALEALERISYEQLLLPHSYGLYIRVSLEINNYEKALELVSANRKAHPQQAEHYFLTAYIYCKQELLDLSIAYFKQAFSLCQSPNEGFDAVIKSITRYNTNDGNLLRLWSEEACHRWQRPIDYYRLLQSLPDPIPQNTDSIVTQRKYIHELATQLLNTDITIPPNEILSLHGQAQFFLAYHNYNDTTLNHLLAEVRFKLLPSQSFKLAHMPKEGEAVRVAWISGHLYDHSVMHCFHETLSTLINTPGLILGLFSVTPSEAQNADEYYINKHFAESAPYIQRLDSNTSIELLAEKIANWQPHILIYPEIGMHPVTALLAGYRLAPLQVVLPGHPITTGIKTIDAFISQACMEPRQAATHYTEKLVCLPGIVHYKRPNVPNPLPTRQQLGLPKHPVYLCPMTPFKFHPDFDEILLSILHEDPDGEIWLPKGPWRFEPQLKQRLQQRLGLMAKRIHWFPWQPRDKFISLLWHCEATLDPLYFGAGNTGYIALGAGVPLITLPGEFFRGRAMYGLYQLMGMSDCIASDPEDYVRLSIRLAHDQEWRDTIREKISHHNSVIFHNNEWNQSLAQFCLNPKPHLYR